MDYEDNLPDDPSMSSGANCAAVVADYGALSVRLSGMSADIETIAAAVTHAAKTVAAAAAALPGPSDPARITVKEEESMADLPADGRPACAVCGDVASGFHYNVSSCNGCKTFFRRTIVAARKFVCLKDGSCQFDKNRRCACRACRYKKCADAGMNSQAIQYTPSANLTLSIARKRFHRSFLQQQQRQKQGYADPQSQSARKVEDDNGEKDGDREEDKESERSSLRQHELWSVYDEVLRRISDVLRREKKLERLRNSAFDPFNDSMTLAHVIDSSNSFADAEKYQVIETWQNNKFSAISWAPDVESSKFWLFLDLFLSVEYLKSFDIFSTLSTAEKISLVKKTAISSAAITAANFSCQLRSDEIIYPDGTYPLNRRDQSQLMKIEQIIKRGMVKELRQLQTDQIQMALIRVIVVLDDTSDQLSEWTERELCAQRQKYASVLLHYLRNRHGDAAGVHRFSETFAFIDALSRFRKLRVDYYAYRTFVSRLSCPTPMFTDCMKG